MPEPYKLLQTMEDLRKKANLHQKDMVRCFRFSAISNYSRLVSTRYVKSIELQDKTYQKVSISIAVMRHGFFCEKLPLEVGNNFARELTLNDMTVEKQELDDHLKAHQ